MTLVVDASVAVKWFLAEDGSDEARAIQAADADLIAPDLIVAEVLNATWKAARLGQFTPEQLTATASALPRHINQLVSIVELASRALVVARQLDHPVYDCFYLALAEREAASLVTADRRLLAKVAGSAWAGQVLALGDWFADRSGPTA